MKSGDVSLNGYNDLFSFVGGDGNDRWWTGGISLNIKAGNVGVLTASTDVFTGERLGKDKDGSWLSTPNNPFGGKYGTYGQSQKNQLLNNGQSRNYIKWCKWIIFRWWRYWWSKPYVFTKCYT